MSSQRLFPDSSAEERRRVTDALAELCLEQGFRATTPAEISGRAGTTRAALGRLFADKHEAFIELLETSGEELFESIGSAVEAEAQREGRLKAGVAALLAWADENQARAFCLFAEARLASPQSLRLYLDGLEKGGRLLMSAAPADVPRPPVTAESLVGGLVTLLGNHLRAGRRSPRLLAPDLEAFLRVPFLSFPRRCSPSPDGAALDLDAA